MAAICRPTNATYVIHDRVSAETSDNEDHTFCGIMFPVKCKDLLPLDRVVITSIAVRGALGPITVWVSNLPNNDNDDTTGNTLTPPNKEFRMHPRYWTKLYEQTHGPSRHTYVSLDLSSNPIILLPGQVRAVYIHSTLSGDEAIVYDNRRQRRSYDDALVSVLTGRAHVSETPFGRTPIWGWGNPWRDQREFVGRIEFGAVYKLWNPATKDLFGKNFQTIVRTLFLCQRRWESPMSKLPDDCIFYILNMCRWDWAGDGGVDMKELRRKRRKRFEEEKREAEREQELVRVQTLQETESDAEEDGGDEDAAAASCCHRLRSANSDDNDAVVMDANVVSASRVVAGTAVAVEEKEDDSDDDDDEDSEYDPQAGTSTYYDDDDEEEEDAVLQDAHDNDSDSELQDEEVAEASGVAARNETVYVEALQGDDSEGWVDSDDDEDDDDDGSYEGDNFRYHDDDSDNDSDDDDDDDQRGGVSIYGADRRAWIRRQFARVHILQQLANMEEQGVIELNF